MSVDLKIFRICDAVSSSKSHALGDLQNQIVQVARKGISF